MSDWSPSRPRPSGTRRLLAASRRALPFAVWAGALLATIWLSGVAPTAGSLPALVDSTNALVTSPVGGRVASIEVSLHAQVEADQVLARLDDQRIRLRLTQATYELERLRADLQLDAANLAQDVRVASAAHGLDTSIEQRRLVSALESAQLAALSTRAQIEETRVRAAGAAIEADRITALAAQGLVAEPELVRARTERDALQKRIGELEAVLAERQQRVQATQERVRKFAAPTVDAVPEETVLAPMRWRLKSQESVLDQIAADQAQLVLRAPMRGRVSRINAQTGEWVAAGRPLIELVDPTPRRILAYAVEPACKPQPAQSVRITRIDRTELGTATIQSVSPTIVRMPERLWRDPRQEQWAYELVVAATGAEVPGERLLLMVR